MSETEKIDMTYIKKKGLNKKDKGTLSQESHSFLFFFQIIFTPAIKCAETKI